MASARAALAVRRLAAATKTTFGAPRHMSGGHQINQAEELAEMTKWRAVTAVAVPGCIAMAVYMLATGEHHHDEKIAYPYLHIRSKQFPWGGDLGFFELPPKADKHGH